MTISAERPFETAMTTAWPVEEWRDVHVVLAVSGGPDSVALLRSALALKQRSGGIGRLFVAHLHHGLRGTAADDDQAWLESLCAESQLPLEVGREDVAAAAAKQGDGYEAAARQARYAFLTATAEKLGARLVATGHTADDQIETVMHRILRGTGVAGLAGIPRMRPLSPSVTVVRPMLNVRRADVLRYLVAIGQKCRTDASNADCRWTRNWLRNELLPAIRTYGNADVDQALLRLSRQAGETQEAISHAAADLALRCGVADSAQPVTVWRFDRRPLADQPLLIVREVFKLAWRRAGWPLQAMGFKEWQQLAELALVQRDMPAITLPTNVRAHREGDFLVLEADAT